LDGVGLLDAVDVEPGRDPNEPLIGVNLAGRYQVRRVVAQGGMGRVYESLDLQVGRRLALKVLHRHVTHDKVAIERFKREYEVSQRLPHEHIVEVFDFLMVDHSTYVIVMDYLDGEALRALLSREGTVPPARLIRMFSQIAIGLDEAHRRQFVHRDIKPDNVFLCGTHDGDVVKLLDFGSVKDTSEGAIKLTMMGTTVGSPFYMSPEQAQGLDTLDFRTDVWALAAIGYEALTGAVPFFGKNGPSILLSILADDPEPASKVAEARQVPIPIPSAVDDVFFDAFVKDPAKRVASVGLLVDELGRAYGLAGSHRQWAYTPVDSLENSIELTLAALVRAKGVRAIEEREPFAVPPQGEPVQCEPVQCEPVQREPVQREPVQCEPVQREPVLCEPVQREPVQCEPVHREPVHRECVVGVEPGGGVPVLTAHVQGFTTGELGALGIPKKMPVGLIVSVIVAAALVLVAIAAVVFVL
jgi:serine/threonine-protein kinase